MAIHGAWDSMWKTKWSFIPWNSMEYSTWNNMEFSCFFPHGTKIPCSISHGIPQSLYVKFHVSPHAFPRGTKLGSSQKSNLTLHKCSVWNDDIYRMTEQPPLSSIVERRRLSQFGHIAHMDGEAGANWILSEPLPKLGRRPSGRPHSTPQKHQRWPDLIWHGAAGGKRCSSESSFLENAGFV